MTPHTRIRALVDGFEINPAGAPLWRGLDGTAEPAPFDPAAHGQDLTAVISELAAEGQVATPGGNGTSPYLPFALETMNPVARGEDEPGRWILTRAITTPKADLIVALHGRPEHYLQRAFNALESAANETEATAIASADEALRQASIQDDANGFFFGMAGASALATRAVLLRRVPDKGVFEISLRESVPFSDGQGPWFLSVGQALAFEQGTSTVLTWNMISSLQRDDVLKRAATWSEWPQTEWESLRALTSNAHPPCLFAYMTWFEHMGEGDPPFPLQNLLSAARRQIAAASIVYLNQTADIPNTDRFGQGPWV